MVQAFTTVVVCFLFQLKIHLQSFSAQSIAVGHQHQTAGMIDGLVALYRDYGVVRGLWRGATGAMVRIGVASSAQLSTMSLLTEALVEHGVLTKEQKFLSTLVSSMLGGMLMAVVMAPFDLVSTRLYNQGGYTTFKIPTRCLIDVGRKINYNELS